MTPLPFSLSHPLNCLRKTSAHFQVEDFFSNVLTRVIIVSGVSMTVLRPSKYVGIMILESFVYFHFMFDLLSSI